MDQIAYKIGNVRELGELDVDETPPFLYQLLLLSRKVV